MKYAIIYESSVFIPGDERSRTNPGHGYPESTMTYDVIKYFDSEEQMLEYIRNRKSYRAEFKYKAIRFEELMVEETITLKVKPVTT